MKKFFFTLSVLLLFIPVILAQTSTLDSLHKLLLSQPDEREAQILYEIAINSTSPDSGIFYLKKALEAGKKINDQKTVRQCYAELISYYYNTRQLDSSISLIKEQLNYIYEYDSTNYTLLSDLHIKLGVNNQYLGRYNKSAENFTKALNISDKLKDYDGMAAATLNLGLIYLYYLNNDNYKTALKNFKEALAYAEKAKNGETFIRAKLNIAKVYENRKELDSALIINKEIIEFVNQNQENLRHPQFLLFQSYLNITNIYIENNEFVLAERTLNDIRKKFPEVLKVPSYKADVKGSFATLYSKWGKTGKAIAYYEQTIDLYAQLGYQEELVRTYKAVSELYAQQGNYKRSLSYFQQYSDLKDSLFNDETAKQINEMQAKYESEKKEREIQLLTKEQEKQKLFNQSILAVSFLLIIVVFLMLHSYLQKKRANAILTKQNDEIKRQKEQIEEQAEEIKDSIKYASRIQRAVLPPVELYDKFFREYFILFRPRDIVSGDFYWMAEKDNLIFVAAADCTGHGVPGAFMSMLGISFLNEIVNKIEVTNAADVLNDLREHIIKALRQTGKANEAKDGMDIALSVIDKENNKVQFAGAYNPLYIIRNGELIQYKADKMPIGIYFREAKPFTNKEIDIQPNDMLYMFSDGYVDQFGGDKGRKFMSKNFKNLLISIADQPMKKQKDILDVKLDLWRGERPQIDDVLVLGIKI